jgi:hypothetical protein
MIRLDGLIWQLSFSRAFQISCSMHSATLCVPGNSNVGVQKLDMNDDLQVFYLDCIDIGRFGRPLAVSTLHKYVSNCPNMDCNQPLDYFLRLFTPPVVILVQPYWSYVMSQSSTGSTKRLRMGLQSMLLGKGQVVVKMFHRRPPKRVF